jgi:chaperonin GroEL (HSP60 family)
MVILASHQQEHEVGDGTNLVIIMAGKLLEKAEALLRMVRDTRRQDLLFHELQLHRPD